MYCSKCGDIVKPGEKYCNRCGNYVGNLNEPVEYQNVEYKEIKNEKKIKENSNVGTMIALGAVAGLVIIILISVFSIIFSSTKYYFTSSTYGTTNVSENPDKNTKIEKSEDTTKSKGKYLTSVVSDNTYSDMDIETEEDAYNLILEDSENQKNNDYPAEIRTVESSIIKNLNITAANLKEMDPEFAKELEKVFEKIYEEYPSVRGYITNLTLVNAGISDQYIAAFMPIYIFATSNTSSEYPWVIKTQVLLNSSYFLNPVRLETSVKDGAESGHFPDNTTIYSPIAHELGHYLSFLAMMKYHNMESILLIDSTKVSDFYALANDFGQGDFSLVMLKEAYQNYINDTNDNIAFDDWRGTISNYALAKDNSGEYIYDETIAEAFHDTYLNGNNSKNASKYIVEVLKKYLEE